MRFANTDDGASWADAALAMLTNMKSRDLIESVPVMAGKIGESSFGMPWVSQRDKIHT